jgi:histidinol phosphatase-like PHP family hydrolase
VNCTYGAVKLCLWDSEVAGASDWYAPQNVEHSLQLKDEIVKYKNNNIKIYFGCEIEYIGNGIASLTDKNAKLYDYVLVPPHHFHMVDFVRPKEIFQGPELEKLFYDRFVETCDIDFAFGIAHPFIPIGLMDNAKEILSSLKDEMLEECFCYAAKKNKSIEINTACLTSLNKFSVMDEYVRIMTIAQKCNCKFHIGSDAHSSNNINTTNQELALIFAERCNIVYPDNPFE